MALPRLKRRREFLRVAGKGKRAARPSVLLQALPETEGPLRVGFTATKKLGNAVVRNRAKRRLRAAAHELLHAAPPPGCDLRGWDLVLVARDGVMTRDWPTLLGDLRGALRQTGVLVRPAADPAPACAAEAGPVAAPGQGA